MKTIALLCTFASFSMTLPAADPALTKEQRAHAVQLLQDAQKEFVAAVESLSDEQWNYKPAPERWSVGEVAEHIVLAEGLLFSKVEESLAGKPNPDWETQTKGKTEFLEKVMVNRQYKAQAPEQIKPQGKLTRAEIMSKYAEGRAKSIKFIEDTDLPLNEYTAEHPFPVFKTLNAYQWLIYIPLHNMRHDLQIEEVKTSAGFPKQTP